MAAEKRLIDPDEFMGWVVKRFKCVPLVGSCDNDSESLKLLLAQAPTVDAMEVVHGRWEWLGPNRLIPECMCGTCSVCKVRSKYIVNTDICPNCGAKMDGGLYEP